MLKTKKIAVIGYGVMGEAILSGLIKKGGIDPASITASGPREERRLDLVTSIWCPGCQGKCPGC